MDFTAEITKLEALATVTAEPMRAVVIACKAGLEKAQDALNEALDERDDARDTLAKIGPKLAVVEAERTEAVTLMKNMMNTRLAEKRAAIRKSAKHWLTKSETNALIEGIRDVIARREWEEKSLGRVVFKLTKAAAAVHDDEVVPGHANTGHKAHPHYDPNHGHDDLVDEKLRPRPLFNEI